MYCRIHLLYSAIRIVNTTKYTMKTSTKYSVSDAATLYKKSRATLYKDIKNGILSRDHDGSIDFSELLRVYGEPSNTKNKERLNTSSIQNENTSEYTDNTFLELKNQIDFLKKQLEKAEDREAKANARIDTLLTLIEMKPSTVNTTTSSDQNIELTPEKETPTETVAIKPEIAMQQPHHEPISVPLHVEPAPKKKGLLGRLAKAVFND